MSIDAGTRRTSARGPAAKGWRASIDATQMSAMKAQGKGRFGNREGAAGFCIVRWVVSCFRIDDDLVTDPRTDRLERVHCSCRHCDYQVGRPGDDIEDAAWNEGSTFELVPSSSLRPSRTERRDRHKLGSHVDLPRWSVSPSQRRDRPCVGSSPTLPRGWGLRRLLAEAL